MSRNGSGVYSLPAGNPVVTATTISSTWANNTLTDIANALTGSLSADGQTLLSGNLNANNNKIINLADPTLAQDAVSLNYLTTQAIPFAGSITAPTAPSGNNSTRVATTAFVQSAVINSVSIGKNRIINGAMMIDQRNAGASVTTGYSVDRWALSLTQSSKYSAQQNAGSVTPPIGFINYLGCTSLSSYTVLTGDTFLISQAIEGFNVADLGFGTANAKTVTLSFQVYSSLTGTFGGALCNAGVATRSYPFTYSIPVANTWTNISIPIVGDTSGSWAINNATGMVVRLGLGSGTTFNGTAGSWASGNYVQPTGTVSVVGTNGATFYVTGVQLETGTNASGFEFRQYGTELALCQRYYSVINMNAQSPSVGFMVTPFYGPVTMRATPTMVQLNGGSVINAIIQGVAANTNQPAGFFQIQATAASGEVINASYSASAEL